jgi:hypothetical protein
MAQKPSEYRVKKCAHLCAEDHNMSGVRCGGGEVVVAPVGIRFK